MTIRYYTITILFSILLTARKQSCPHCVSIKILRIEMLTQCHFMASGWQLAYIFDKLQVLEIKVHENI